MNSFLEFFSNILNLVASHNPVTVLLCCIFMLCFGYALPI
jgi:hypothetical protein